MVLPEGTTALLRAARDLRPRLLASRDRVEAARRIPADLAAELAAEGFFRLWLPAAYGGLDLTPAEGLTVIEELAQADAAVAWCVWNGNTYWTVAQLAPAAARAIFSGPAVITANSTQPKGRAEVVAGGYRVSGRWSLVSGCQIADWVQLLCSVQTDGSPQLTAAGTPQLRYMYCRASDCTIVDTWNSGGLRGTGSHDVIVESVFVPEDHASAPADPRVLDTPQARYPAGTRVGAGLGAIALGIARSAIAALVELGGAKRPERSSQTLSAEPGAQTRLSQAEALVCAARGFLFDSVEHLWQRVGAGETEDINAWAHVRLAGLHAVSSAVQAVDLCYLTGGATSLYTSFPFERALRDVHAITQHIAAHPRTLELTGQALFGLPVDPANYRTSPLRHQPADSAGGL